MGDTDNPNLNRYYLGSHAIMDDYFNAYYRDGAWSEGVSYASYGQANGSGAIYYVEALKHVKGEDLSQHPKFKNAMNFPIYFSPPGRQSATDSFNTANFGEGYSGAATAWFISTNRNGLAQWYYSNVHQQHSEMTGALVYLDDMANGTTPKILSRIPSGTHTSKLARINYLNNVLSQQCVISTMCYLNNVLSQQCVHTNSRDWTEHHRFPYITSDTIRSVDLHQAPVIFKDCLFSGNRLEFSSSLMARPFQFKGTSITNWIRSHQRISGIRPGLLMDPSSPILHQWSESIPYFPDR